MARHQRTLVVILTLALGAGCADDADFAPTMESSDGPDPGWEWQPASLDDERVVGTPAEPDGVEVAQEPAAPPTPPVVSNVAPAQGPSCGGSRITVAGGPFGPDTRVYFADVAAEVVAYSADTVEVLLPELDVVGPVDVSVSDGTSEVLAEQPFEVWPAANGKARYLWNTVRYEIANPDHWQMGESFVTTHLYPLAAPAAVSTEELLADQEDYCTVVDTAEFTAVWGGLELGEPDALTVSSEDGTPLDLEWSDGDDGYHQTFAPDVWPAALELHGAATPAVSLQDVVPEVPSLTVSEPDLGAWSPPSAAAESFEVVWESAGQGDYIGLWMLDAEADVAMRCRLADDGFAQLPPSLVSLFEWRTVELDIVRYSTRDTPLWFDNSVVRAEAGSGVVGRVLVTP